MPQINVQLVNPNFDQRTTLPSQASSRKLAAEEMGAGRCGQTQEIDIARS
jgi:hypothetical protein